MSSYVSSQTVFYFDIQRKHFRGGLDIFAQFFIKPLMMKDSIDREVDAVNSGQCHQFGVVFSLIGLMVFFCRQSTVFFCKQFV